MDYDQLNNFRKLVENGEINVVQLKAVLQPFDLAKLNLAAFNNACCKAYIVNRDGIITPIEQPE